MFKKSVFQICVQRTNQKGERKRERQRQARRAVQTNLWHSGHSTNQDDLSNVGLLYFGILQSFLAGTHGTFHQVFHQRLKLGPGQLHVHVFWSAGIHRQVRQVDVRLQQKLWLGYPIFLFSFCKEFTVSNSYSPVMKCEAMKNDVKDMLLKREFHLFRL